MAGVAFETALGNVFARCDQAIAERLQQVRAKSEALQSQDTSRLAFTLTEAIEREIQPAVDQALAVYDAAINRPLTPNVRWEQAVRSRIGYVVDAAVEKALKLDAAQHPWKPLLARETPELRERLSARADRHFDELRKQTKTRRRQVVGAPEMLVRLGTFAGGAIVGALAMHLATRG